ncbi:MAG: DUF2442 domain-containing protein [Candidatus Latescibacterota bacterium]
MMLEVTKARYEKEYRIRIEFNDGKSGVVDLKDDLWGSVFEPLKDQNEFKRFTVSEILHTISWENDADFAPEYLYHKCLTECPT